MNHDQKLLMQKTTELQMSQTGHRTLEQCISPNPTRHNVDGDDLCLETRRGVIQQKSRSRELRSIAAKEMRGLNDCPERTLLLREIQDRVQDENNLEQSLQKEFIPQHGPAQFIGPRAFFVSPLFRVCKENSARKAAVLIELTPKGALQPIRYEGPELRQTDALVFLTLLHLLRDVKAKTAIRINPSEVCKAIFKGYDGPKRKKLQSHIFRLQKGLIIFQSFSVQLCLQFDFPKVGAWSVSLDPKIVELFSITPKTWLRMEPRLGLTNGLTTWLFSFIEAQTRLIPMQVEKLLNMCGSESTVKPFTKRLQIALEQLSNAKIIDGGWSIRRGELRWMKSKASDDFQRTAETQ